MSIVSLDFELGQESMDLMLLESRVVEYWKTWDGFYNTTLEKKM